MSYHMWPEFCNKVLFCSISLPNPPENLLKRLDKIFYKCIWNSGPDRISRNNMIRNESEGGLRMIQITFIKALKITWLRRLLINPNNILWSSLSNIEFAKLFSLGDGYALHKIQELRNPFWTDILQSWKKFINCQKAENLSDIPLRRNSARRFGLARVTTTAIVLVCQVLLEPVLVTIRITKLYLKYISMAILIRLSAVTKLSFLYQVGEMRQKLNNAAKALC